MSIAIKRNFTIPSTSAIGASELYITSSAGSTSTGTGALQVSGGAGISGNLSVGGNLNLFNGAFYTGLRSSATATTTYTLPPTTPSTGSSVLSSDAAGNLSWILMSASGSGFTLNGLTSSTQYFSTSISGSGFSSSSIGSTHTFYIGLAGYASTGLISSTSQTLFGLKTFASGLAITSATASTSTTTGSVTITGGVGIGGSLWTSSTNYSSISGVGISNGAITGNLTGTATSAALVNIDASTGTRYLIGTLLNSASGSTQLSTGSGITIGNNIITATTFAGNATSSTNSGASGKWISSRTVTFATGDITGSFSMDGSADVSNVALTIGANSVALGTDTTGNYVGTVATSGSGISTIGSAGEGATFTIDSNATSNNTASTLVFRDSSGNFSAGTISASLTGTASIATSAANLNTVTDTSSTLYLIGSRSSTGIASTQVYVDTNISFSGNTITATTFSGTATSALNAGTQNTVSDTTSTIYFTGSRLSTGTAATTSYVLSGVSALGNTLTATTFNGSLSGTASTSTNLVTSLLSGTMYLTGQASSSAASSGTSQLVGSGLSFVSSTGTLTAAFFVGSGNQLSGIVTSLTAGSGISINASSGPVTVYNSGVVSLTGTSNQVLVGGASGVATSGNITLTLPQSIGTASSPSFADITLSTGTNSTIASVGTQPTSIVNKQYVDNLAAGLDIHASVRLLQSSAFTANYVQAQSAGSASTGSYLISTTQVALPAIDGVTISATGTTQRVLVTSGFTGTASIAGTTPFTPGNSNIANGIYYVGALGGAGTSNWILVRATDTDDNIELTAGTFCFIEEGTSYGDSGWVCTNDTTNNGPIVFGSTAITFSQFTGGAALAVGQGLNKVGSTIATNVKLTSTGVASGIGFTQFNIGGASLGGVADTGFYPTFSVRTSGTVAGSSILTLNSDGFSLIGSTNSNRTLTVTGSDITLTGGGNTLTLTGSISLPSPTLNGVAYGSSSSAISFLTSSGSGASILSQTTGSAPVYLGQSQLVVGGATTSAQWQTSRTVTFATGDVTGSFSIDGSADVSNVALTIAANSVVLGTDTTGNYAASISTSGSGISTIGTAGEGTAFTINSNATSSNTVSTLVFRDSSGNFSAGTITASLTGTASIATSAASVNTVTDTSSTLYLIGSRSSTGIASTQVYVDTNISFSGNTITATTFSGTASSALNTGTANIVSDTSNTIYFTGSRSNTSIGATAIYVLSGVSALGNTITATTFSGTATSSTNTANTNITLDTTSTIYLTGSRSNASIGSTPVYVLSGVSALGSTITATTFTGTLSGTASSAALINIAASTATRYLAAVTLNTASGSTQLFTGSGITIGDNRLTTGGLAVTSGTASTNTTTGALTINGGVGITGQLSINTMALGSTGVAVTPSIVFAGSAGTVITMSVLSDTTLAWEGSSGQLFSIDNNLSSGEIFSVSDISGLPLISASAGQTITLNEFGGFTQVGNGLASTSTTTGALRVIGGIGITGNAYVGGSINANAGTNSTSTTTGAVVINGGLGVTGNANIGGTVRIQNTTAATGNSSAAFTVAGGAGIGQSLFVAGNSNLSGSVFTGTNTYTKNLGSGDIALDNGSVDSPAILFYWGNNRNMGVDTFYSGAGTTRFRIVRELNEVGGSELWSVDRNGIVTRSAWDVGEVINTRVYNNSDLSMSATTTINSTTYTNVATITYTPKSSTSHLWIEFDAHYDFSNGTTTDDFFSRITVAGSSIVEKNQIMVGQVGGGTRSGTIFPISGRYTNSSTSGIAITVQAKWGSADDAIRVYGSSTSGYMRIQEIGR